jgi:hypothetical protein
MLTESAIWLRTDRRLHRGRAFGPFVSQIAPSTPFEEKPGEPLDDPNSGRRQAEEKELVE